MHLAQNGLEQLNNLTKLALESNLICNEGLEAISFALQNNRQLREIYLYNNELNSESMEPFA